MWDGDFIGSLTLVGVTRKGILDLGLGHTNLPPGLSF